MFLVLFGAESVVEEETPSSCEFQGYHGESEGKKRNALFSAFCIHDCLFFGVRFYTVSIGFYRAVLFGVLGVETSSGWGL